MRFILATCIWEDLVQRKKPVTDRLRSKKRRYRGVSRKCFLIARLWSRISWETEPSLS